MPSVDSGAWCSKDDVKEHLDIASSESRYDNFIINLINNGYKILEKHIGFAVKTASYTEYYDGDDTGELLVKKWPIVAVDSIYVDNERLFGSDTLASSDNYYIDQELGMIRMFQSISGPSWFLNGIANVKITYTAGFDTIPADLKEALIEYVSWLYRRSNTEGTTAQSLGGKSESYDEKSLPDYIRAKLAHYRSRGV